MCDPMSMHNQFVQQNINNQIMQDQFRFIQEQNDFTNQQLLNNVIQRTNRPVSLTPVIKLADSLKAKFAKKYHPEKDTVEFNNTKKEVKIPGINAPGIHRDENGVIDGIIGGMTEDGNFIHVSPADDRIGGRTADGKMWDGVKVQKPEPKIPGINAPGIHRGENGVIDGIIGGMTEDGKFIHVSPADDRIGGMTNDGKLWDGKKN